MTYENYVKTQVYVPGGTERTYRLTKDFLSKGSSIVPKESMMPIRQLQRNFLKGEIVKGNVFSDGGNPEHHIIVKTNSSMDMYGKPYNGAGEFSIGMVALEKINKTPEIHCITAPCGIQPSPNDNPTKDKPEIWLTPTGKVIAAIAIIGVVYFAYKQFS